MDRMVAFYRGGVGLTVVFYSPFWTRWREATIASHAGGTGDERDRWLGFHVTDVRPPWRG